VSTEFEQTGVSFYMVGRRGHREKFLIVRDEGLLSDYKFLVRSNEPMSGSIVSEEVDRMKT